MLGGIAGPATSHLSNLLPSNVQLQFHARWLPWVVGCFGTVSFRRTHVEYVRRFGCIITYIVCRIPKALSFRARFDRDEQMCHGFKMVENWKYKRTFLVGKYSIK